MRMQYGVNVQLEAAADALLFSDTFANGVREGGSEVWKMILSPTQLEHRARHEFPVGNDPTMRRGLHYRAENKTQFWLNSIDGGIVPLRVPRKCLEGYVDPKTMLGFSY